MATLSAPLDAAMFDALVRMVVPMRREFGLTLDVQQARRDTTYARHIVAQARSSHAERLRGYADFVESLIEEEPAEPPADLGVRERTERQPDLAQARQVARRLIDTVGPRAEPLAVRLEAARDADSLRSLLAAADALVEQLRGPACARAWRDTLPPA